MDIIKAFHNNDLNIEVTIKGTHENPLFRASDIGEVLGMSNVRTSISNYSEDEKVLLPHETSNGIHNVIFLTEQGLYKLLFKSEKPIAKVFQKWVFDVIREIRLNGQYLLSKRIEELEQELEEMSDLNDGVPIIYIFVIDKPSKKYLLKIGATEHGRKRFKPYRQTHKNGYLAFKAEVDMNVENLKAVEKYIHQLLSRYRIKDEVFEMDLDEAKMWVELVVSMNNISLENNYESRLRKLSLLVDSNTNILQKENPTMSVNDVGTQTTTELAVEAHKIDLHTKFDTFINECCVLGIDNEVAATEIIGQYRIWAQNAEKEVYHALLDYLKERFKPVRLRLQDKDQVVNGYKGVSLITTTHKLSFNPSDPELFVFHKCRLVPNGKTLISDLVKEYTTWKQATGRTIDSDDKKLLLNYLDSNKHVLKSNIWAASGNGIGFWGIALQSDVLFHKKPSTTAKRVEKRTKDNVVLESYSTIAKAAQAEGIYPTKLSRLLKDNKAIFEDHYYTLVKQV